MILNVSERGGNAMLNAIAELMDGGSIELLSGNGVVLAAMKLVRPGGQDAASGELELNKITEGIATAAGQRGDCADPVTERRRSTFVRLRWPGQRRGDQAHHHGDQQGRPGAADLVSGWRCRNSGGGAA